MHLYDVVPAALLLQMMDEGYVSERKHPEKDLWIYNYSAQAQYMDRWNDATINCRGLIVDKKNNIIARPFKKFFNLGQAVEPMDEWQGDELAGKDCVAYDKLDGSLGIVFHFEGEWDVATRGSFESEQAIWARKKLQTYRYALVPRYTYLVEIVYPENRVVCDYGDKEDLILLGATDPLNGDLLFPHDLAWFGERAQIVAEGTLEEILKLPPREGKEGLVLYFEDGQMWKLKQDDYVRLHRLVFGLTERKIWAALAVTDVRENNGYGETFGGKEIAMLLNLDLETEVRPIPQTFNEWAREVPDEFSGWLNDVVERLDLSFQELSSRLADESSKIQLESGMATQSSLKSWRLEDIKKLQRERRKEYARLAKESDLCAALFAERDRKHHIADAILWKMIKPEHSRAIRTQSEDIA